MVDIGQPIRGYAKTGALCKRWAVAIYLPTVSRMVKSCGSVALLARIVSYPDRVVTRSDDFLWDKKDAKDKAICEG